MNKKKIYIRPYENVVELTEEGAFLDSTSGTYVIPIGPGGGGEEKDEDYKTSKGYGYGGGGSIWDNEW